MVLALEAEMASLYRQAELLQDGSGQLGGEPASTDPDSTSDKAQPPAENVENEVTEHQQAAGIVQIFSGGPAHTANPARGSISSKKRLLQDRIAAVEEAIRR